MRFLYFLLLCITITSNISAQHQRIMHRTFQLDTATILELDLFGEFTVETWVGSDVMIETNVRISNVPEGIFNHYIKEGRYAIEEKREGETLLLVSKQKERPKIKTPKGDSEEIVTVKVFIPDVMEASGDKRWTKPKDEKKD
ncbi:MAG: hypothetical protein ACK4TA_12565 [Saprospiraceae bacterium]